MARFRGNVLRRIGVRGLQFATGCLLSWMLAACGGGSDEPVGLVASRPAVRALANDGLTRIPLATLAVSANLIPSFVASGLVDGDAATPAWHIDGLRFGLPQYGVQQGPYVAVDLGAGRELAVVRIGIYAAAQPPSTLYYVCWSDDGATWQYADNAGLLVSAAGWNSVYLGAGTGAHRYWRVLLRETASDTGPWMTDLGLWTDGTPAYVEHPHDAAAASQFGMPAWHPENLCDHNTATGAWHNDGAPALSWVAVDFGTPRDLRQLRLFFFFDQTPFFAFQFDVQWSNDGAAWTTVALMFAHEHGWNTSAWAGAGAHRHWRLRLQATARPGPWIGEWQWMGPSGSSLEGFWPIVSSSLSEDGITGWQPDGITDGDTTTYGWHTDSSNANAWVQFDLGTPRAVERLAVFRVTDSSGVLLAHYAVGGSNDGVNYEVGLAPLLVSETPGWSVVALDSPRTYRYWRLFLTNMPGPGAWISEARLLPPAY